MSYASMTPGFSTKAMPLIETVNAVGEEVADWSRCRSPARAKRREKRGFPQHVHRFRKPACYEANGTLYIHPALAIEMRKKLNRQIDNDIVATMMAGSAGLRLSQLGYRFRP